MSYFHLLLFAVLGVGFGLLLLAVGALVRARHRDPQGLSPYECGMESVGTPWVSPNIRFYTFALLFVLFDVEAVFLFPWAARFRELGAAGFLAILLFAGVLVAGLIYAWKKGALVWE